MIYMLMYLLHGLLKMENMQMIAGGDGSPIWFTNLICGGYLYTYTHKWPGIVGTQKCSKLFPLILTRFFQLLYMLVRDNK